ncbi:MAG: Mov34/MPN/PAD-1 family protein [Nanoarchaeota archaeon]
MKNDAIVFLSPNAYQSLLVSAVEVYPRETNGLLTGYKLPDGNYRVEHAHPFQTSERGFEWTCEGNNSAVKRVQTLLAALNGQPSRPHAIGGYHSHPQRRALAKVSPSEKDLAWVREKLSRIPEENSWLELIMRVDVPFLERPSEKGPTHYRRLKKLRTTVRHAPTKAYGFLTGAFLIHPEEGYDELRVELAQKPQHESI